MPLGIYRSFYLRSSPQHPCLIDDQGNVEQVQIRGSEVVLGDGAVGLGRGSVAIGTSALSQNVETIVVGARALASQAGGIAIGRDSRAFARGTALGDGAVATADFTTAIGRLSLAAIIGCVALGDTALAQGNASISIGYLSQSLGVEAIAIGGDSGSVAANAAQAQGNQSIAIGTNCRTDLGATNSISIGTDATCTTANAVAIGGGVVNSHPGSIQLGTAGAAFIKQTASSRMYRAFGGFSSTNAPSAAALIQGGLVITAQCTLPSAAAIQAALPDPAVGDAFNVTFINDSAGDLDFRGGAPAGITFVAANSTITANTERTALFLMTNVTGGAEAISVF